eukprot:GEMP01089857.1.p1 GENE.GEMP01089857.1~~GEMP01089857.1.p1  ORF type:complete len:116 (+),score=14.38 GEMP01089857.1:111-458(+)
MSAAFQMALAKTVSQQKSSSEVCRRPVQESRHFRGHLTFLERMEVDSRNKRIDKMTANMRTDEICRHRMDKETRSRLQKDFSGKLVPGPRVARHDSKKHYEGHHDKEMCWGPLDM